MNNELITVREGTALLNLGVSARIADFERNIKRLKEAEEELKKAILKEMEEKGIIKLDTPHLLISYIAPTDRESFDSARFRAEYSDLYDDFIKMSPVKASIRIKVKNDG